MNKDHTENMARARAAKAKSSHPIHKVGACITLPDGTAAAVHNYCPQILGNTIGKENKLGNASATIHAEINALIQAPASTNMANMYVTELPCPNCAKTKTEAGFSNIYIDSSTYNTPLGKKMLPFFKQVSLLIFERAGIGVHEIDPDNGKITTLLKPSPRENERVFENTQIQEAHNFEEQIQALQLEPPFAACIAEDKDGKPYFLAASISKSQGLTQSDIAKINAVQDKYEPYVQPFDRLLAHCAYHNLQIKDGYLYTSQTPSAREFVNMTGCGITSISIGDPAFCRDQWGLVALEQIRRHNIMEIRSGYFVKHPEPDAWDPQEAVLSAPEN